MKVVTAKFRKMELKSLNSNSPTSPAKSKFSIDSILQLNSATPTSQQPTWNAVPQAQLHLQQQKAVMALALQQQRHQQQRNLQLILNAGQPFHSILALGNSKHQPNSSLLASATPPASSNVSIAPIAAYIQSPPRHGHKQAVPPRMDTIHTQRARLRSPPEMLVQQLRCFEQRDADSGGSSSRRRQSSTGVSNDSDEDHDSVIGSSSVAECSRQIPLPDSKMASPQSREIAFKKSRTSFTKGQIQTLEVKFSEQKYLTKLDRTKLARELGLTEKHVKTWFQNRRTKWKKDCSDIDWSKHKEMAATLMYNQYLENKTSRTED